MVNQENTSTGPEVIVLKFADSSIPKFKEVRNKDYVLYGEDNLYPQYLTYLFDKSAKHNAILTGKAYYIFGKGYENGEVIVNRLGETANDIVKKIILDIVIYGGFRLEIIWGRGGKIVEIYHVDYSTLRLAKNGGFYFCEQWKKWNSEDDIQFIEAFNPSKPFGSQIYAYNEYRPMVRYYPLPDYIGCNNYIETDIEISKFYLSAIRNGMMPSKMIQFFKGEPGEEKKKEIERRMDGKFGGSENAGKFLLVFNDASNVNQTVKVDDLSGTELDKMFIELNKTTQQEIFSGHLVTSPALFGIKTEGQLGATQELKVAYEIFLNTYSKPKAKAVDREINYLLKYSLFPGQYELQPTDPIGLQFDVSQVIDVLPKEFILEKLGVPREQWGTPTAQPAMPAQADMVNEHIKNLTGRQWQHVERIQRKYKQGAISEQQARMLLATGYGLTDEQINTFLNIVPAVVQPLSMSADDSEDAIIALFDACGESKEDFEVIKSKKVCFEIEEAQEDEEIWKEEAFKTFDVTTTEDRILELIKKDPRITPEVIAKTIGQTKTYVDNKLDSLTKRGYLENTTEAIGEDIITVRSLTKTIAAPPIDKDKVNPTQIFVKYSYEGPRDDRNRPFCAKMLELNRLYSRAEIEKISERLGYSVFDRRGGFWTRKGGGKTTPYCRHKWQSHIVVKKGGNKS